MSGGDYMSALLYVQQVILLVLFSCSFFMLLVELDPENSLQLVAAFTDLMIFCFSWGRYTGWKDFRNQKIAENPDLAEKMPENVLDMLLFHDRYMNDDDDKDEDDKKGDDKK
jgi:phosphoglycerol transferase MdoB-like AlkP superfamily enzyme